MRSYSNLSKLLAIALVVSVLAIGGMSQHNALAGVAAQATMSATSAAPAATMASTTPLFPPCPGPMSTGEAGMMATMAAATPDMGMMAATANPNPGYLGIRAEQVDDCGSLVIEVVPDSPASKVDIQADDVIVAVDGMATPSINALRTTVQMHMPGDMITLTLQRKGQQMDVQVTLGTAPMEGPAGATMAATMAATQ